MQKSSSKSYKVKTVLPFEKEARHLSKKYPSLKKELQKLVSELKQNPDMGIPLGRNCYKIRISIKSKGKGRSGGGRIITHVLFREETVFLLSIFDKAELETLGDKEIQALIKKIPV